MNRSSQDNPVIVNQPGSISQRENRNGQGYFEISIVNSSVSQVPNGNNLHKLADMERVIIKPKKEMRGDPSHTYVFGWEVESKYDILNEENEVIYVAEETSDCCMRFWFGSQRSLKVSIKDMEDNPVIFLERPLFLHKGSCWLQAMNISVPQEAGIGEIKQLGGCNPELHVKDEHGNVEFIIRCPWMPTPCCEADVPFPIFALDGERPIGRISRNWSGIVDEATAGRGIFGIQFPPGIGISSKVLLIGATFLLNYMFFEEKSHGPPLTIHTNTTSV